MVRVDRKREVLLVEGGGGGRVSEGIRGIAKGEEGLIGGLT